MKHLLLAIGLLMMALGVHAQVPEVETWVGELNAGASKLRIGFHIKPLSEGGYACTMDVPEQGAKGIPVEMVRNDADSLHLSIPALRASFKGAKVEGQEIRGHFSQNGATMGLDLRRGTLEINRPQTPKGPYAYPTEEVEFRSDSAVLSGTLTYPIGYNSVWSGETPVVLMVTGSGSQNRDEEIFNHKPFHVIADHLAKQGIASLRYDDRGVGKSVGSLKDVTTLDYLADAKAGVEFLRGMGKFSKVGVIGHSEGGTIAFMLGAEQLVDFIISLAGSAASGVDVIVGQNKALMQLQGANPMLAEDYGRALQILYKDRVDGVRVENPSEYVSQMCSKHSLSLPDAYKTNLQQCITAGGEWFTWFLAYHPVEAISKIACPVMALNGTLDMQVLCKDNIPLIQANLPSNEKHWIKEYDSLNHMFQHCTPATAFSYGEIEETIAVEVLEDMAKWIRGL